MLLGPPGPVLTRLKIIVNTRVISYTHRANLLGLNAVLVGGSSVSSDLWSSEGTSTFLSTTERDSTSCYPVTKCFLNRRNVIKTLDKDSKGSSEPSPKANVCSPPGTVRTRREGLKSSFVVADDPRAISSRTVKRLFSRHTQLNSLRYPRNHSVSAVLQVTKIGISFTWN